MYSVLTGGAFQSIGQTMERRYEMNQAENPSNFNRESSKESDRLRYDRFKRSSLDIENEDFCSKLNISRVPKQTEHMKIPVLDRPDQPSYIQSDQPTYQPEYYNPPVQNSAPKHIYIIEKHIPYPPSTEKPICDKCDCFENCSSEYKLKSLRMYTSCCEKCRELFLSNFSDNCKCPKKTKKPKKEFQVESIESEEGLCSKIQKIKDLKGSSCNCSEQTKFNINISNQNTASANVGHNSKIKLHKIKKNISVEESKSLKQSDLKKILRILRRNSLKERKERPPPQCVKFCSAEMEKLEKNISDLRKLRKKLRLPVHTPDREDCSASSSSVDLNEDIYLRRTKNNRKPNKKIISRSSSEELPEKENCGNRNSKKRNRSRKSYKSASLQSISDKKSCGEISVQLIEALKTCSSNSDESNSNESSQNKSECSYEQIHRYNFPIPKISRGANRNGTRSGRYNKRTN